MPIKIGKITELFIVLFLNKQGNVSDSTKKMSYSTYLGKMIMFTQIHCYEVIYQFFGTVLSHNIIIVI